MKIASVLRHLSPLFSSFPLSPPDFLIRPEQQQNSPRPKKKRLDFSPNIVRTVDTFLILTSCPTRTCLVCLEPFF